jgi:hypothetical protein
MITIDCLTLPSIQKLYQQERTLEKQNNRKSIAELKRLIVKEQHITNQMYYLAQQKLYCNSINWGFSSNYNWR